MAYEIPDIWCDATPSELEKFLRQYPRPLEPRPPLTQTKVNYREWLDTALGDWPANVVVKTWKRCRCTGCQLRGDTAVDNFDTKASAGKP